GRNPLPPRPPLPPLALPALPPFAVAFPPPMLNAMPPLPPWDHPPSPPQPPPPPAPQKTHAWRAEAGAAPISDVAVSARAPTATPMPALTRSILATTASCSPDSRSPLERLIPVSAYRSGPGRGR